MSVVCTCLNPEPRPAQTASGNDKACALCGHWWMPKHGSRLPAPPGMLNVDLRLEQVRQNVIKIGRNDTCPCGSGKKYKRCCLTQPR